MQHQFNLTFNLKAIYYLKIFYIIYRVVMSVLSKKSLLLLCKTLGINIQSIKYKNKHEIRKIIKDYEDTKQTKIIASGKTIKYIYHSADIHIRTLDRHQEYEKVFENLYSKLLEYKDDLKESVFVICGDIFHNRDRLISETIIIFNKFIEKLTSIIDVIMIPGNHDIFTHTDRLDTISGIVNIKAYPNFYFFKYSGIYCYHNINFVVSSLVDNKFIRANEIECNNNIKICLYHGSITGSKLDNNFNVPDNNLFKVRDFHGFDYVLLGDIHKKQYLAHNIAYPGSLIQQNFKEEIDHGILKWDIINKTSEFLKINNDYGYITIDIKNNTFNNNIDFPNKSRIKLTHDYTEDIDYDKVKQNISNFTHILSISKEINSYSQSENENDITKEISKDNLDNELFNKLILKYPENSKKELLSLHLNYLKKEENTTVLSNSSWYVKNLEFKNVYIYGNNHINKINFQDKKGVIGILQNNASGKSSIMNIILYTLFGHITKTKSFLNRNIINKGSNDYFIKMSIIMGSHEYIIHRKGKNKTRKNKSKSMDETIEFICDDINLTDTDKIVTQDKIKKTFGLTDKELFILTNVINYSNYISLLNMTSSDIGNVFSKLFNLEHYKHIYSSVLKECKILNDEIKLLNGKSVTLQETFNEPVSQQDLSNIQDQLNIHNKNLELINTKLEYTIKQIALVNTTNINNISYLNEEISLQKQLIDLQSYEHLYTDFSINEINRQIQTLKKQLINNKTQSTTETLDNLYNKKNKIKFHKNIRPCSIKEFDQAQKFLSNYSNIDTNSIFDNYNHNEDLIIKKQDVQKFKTLLDLINNTDMLQSYIDGKVLVTEYNKFIEISNINNTLQNEYDTLSEKINFVISEQLSNLENKKKYLEVFDKLHNIKTYKLNLENIKNKEHLHNTKLNLETEKSNINNYIRDLLNKQTKFNLLLTQQQNCIIKLNQLKSEILKLEKKEELYKQYKSIINDKSLPKLILKNTIKQIEKEANKIIYSLAGLLVFINDEDNDSEGTKWEILIKKNGMILGSEQISGYERFVINVGIKMALDKYKFYSGSSIFFIDEAFDCVSEENIDKIDQLFDYLRSYYRNILIISHNEELKKKIDYRINISTDFVSSTIN